MPSRAKESDKGLRLPRTGGLFTGQEEEQMFGNYMFVQSYRWSHVNKIYL